MRKDGITVTLQTADRTRRAAVTVTRDMTTNDIIKVCRKKWSLGFGVDYQVYNLTNGRQLLPHDWLTEENVRNGDALMLQPFPTHG